MKRATAVEGDFETLLVKIAVERHVTDDEVQRLGRFREGYQQLRECIEGDKPLPFRVQFDAEQVRAYVAF